MGSVRYGLLNCRIIAGNGGRFGKNKRGKNDCTN